MAVGELSSCPVEMLNGILERLATSRIVVGDFIETLGLENRSYVITEASDEPFSEQLDTSAGRYLRC
jgi:hypothetical protein